MLGFACDMLTIGNRVSPCLLTIEENQLHSEETWRGRDTKHSYRGRVLEWEKKRSEGH